MKVILNTTVPKVGKEGQIVNVADGFARNYLFPRNLAIVAEKRQVAALERRHAKLAAKLEEGRSAAESFKVALDGKTVRIPGKVGQGGTKLFGAVTAQDVADAIKVQLNHDLDKRRVALIEPIKRLGAHTIHLDLHRDVDAFITVEVYDPDAPVAAPPAPEPAPVETAPAEA
jgi:large subunit ribosomal protein L9